MIQAIAAGVLLLGQAISTPSTTATVQGVVIADDTGAPLSGAHVSLFRNDAHRKGMVVDGSDGHQAAEAGTLAVTDVRGQFQFKDLEAGTFSYYADRNGYERSKTVDVSAAPDQTANDVVIRMTSTAIVTGRVSGHIRDSAGRPVPLVTVQLAKRQYDSSGHPYFENDATVQTNDLGEYRMYGIEPGRYWVVAGSTDNFQDRSGIAVRAYPMLFYPGVKDVRLASAIAIAPGVEKAGVDFQMNPVPLHRIRGRVIDSGTGQPPADPSVTIDRLLLNGYRSAGVSYNPATGVFDSGDLAPGLYTIGSWIRQDDNHRAYGYTLVSLGDFDIDGGLLTNEPLHSVSGRIRVEGGSLPPGATLEGLGNAVEMIPENDLALLRNVDRTGSVTNAGDIFSANADGTFTLKRIPNGEFRIDLNSLPPGLYLKEANLDGLDALNQSQSFIRASSLEIVIASARPMEGTLRNEELKPVPQAYAVLIPAAQNRTDLFQSARADASGHFIFAGVAPGDYTLIGVQELDDEDYEYFDRGFLPSLEGPGQLVHITGSPAKPFDVKITPRAITP